MHPKIHDELVSQAIAWAEDFALCVRNRDFANARTLFASTVHSYGTKAVEVSSLDQLLKEQWCPTWHRTQRFAYLAESMDIQLSQDGSVAIVCARWRSEGVDSQEAWERQQPYERSGRCTFVLTRQISGSLICNHTHFSLDPGTGPN